MKTFEDLIIKELRELTEQFKEQNPDIRSAQELLEGLNKFGGKKLKWITKQN